MKMSGFPRSMLPLKRTDMLVWTPSLASITKVVTGSGASPYIWYPDEGSLMAEQC